MGRKPANVLVKLARVSDGSASIITESDEIHYQDVAIHIHTKTCQATNRNLI